jgi:hypothetical protein
MHPTIRAIGQILSAPVADLLRGRSVLARGAKPRFTRRLSLLLVMLCAALVAWWCTDHFATAMIHRGPPPAAGPSAQALEFASSVQNSGHWREQNKARQLIDAVPLPGEEGNPVALIRAVNQLQSMGQEQAVVALRGYLQTHDVASFQVDRLFVIIPLVFPIEKEPPSEKPAWKWYPAGAQVVLKDDMPFKTSSGGYALQGQRPAPDYLVDWATTQGVLRAQPLRPCDDPLEAADALYRDLESTPDFQQVKPWLKAYLRWQAWRTVADLIDSQPRWSAPFVEERSHPELSDDAFWQGLKDKAAAAHIRWSPEQQKYVAGGAASTPDE